MKPYEEWDKLGFSGYHDVDKYYEETEEEKNERRVSQLMKEFDENPNLLNQLVLELRKRKLQKIYKNDK